MRMRVLGGKMRVENENESSQGGNEIEIENETPNFQEWGSDKDLNYIFYDYIHIKIFILIEASRL